MIQLEEQHLRSLFPSYGDYARRVSALLPTLRPLPSDKLFRSSLYLYNREYQALLGFVAGALLLCFKAFH